MSSDPQVVPLTAVNGRLSLGQAALSSPVVVRLDAAGLAIADHAGQDRVWPFDKLSSALPLSGTTGDVILTTAAEPDAQLWLDDRALIADLARRAPSLAATHARWRRVWPGLVFAAVVSAFAGTLWSLDISPATVIASRLPDETRVRFGKNVIASMTGGRRTCTTPAGQGALDALDAKLLANVPGSGGFRIAIVDWPIVNAYTAPGGQIVIARALLERAQGPDEVAGVLAHEIGHAIERHPEAGVIRVLGLSAASELMLGGSSGMVGNVGLLLTQLSYTRDAEREADAHAFRLLKAARISPKGLAAFFRRTGAEQAAKSKATPQGFDILSTHPATMERAGLAEAIPPYPSEPALDAAQWQALRTICGVATPPRPPSQPAVWKPAIKAPPSFAAAEALLQAGKPDQAILLYDQAIAANPAYMPAWVGRAKSYYRKSDYDRTIADATRAIELDTAWADAYNVRGNGFLSKHVAPRAIADYTQALTLSPGTGITWSNRSAAYRMTGQYDLAIADSSKAIELSPLSAHAFTGRGVSYGVRHEYARAIEDHTKAISLDPKLAMAYFNRAFVYNQRAAATASRADYDLALADFTKAIELTPDYFQAYNYRSITYRNLGDSVHAMADLDKAVAINPKFAAGYVSRARLHLDRSDTASAVADATRAVETGTELVSAYTMRSHALFAAGQFKAAAADFSRLVNLNGDEMVLRYLTRARAGEAAEAELETGAAKIQNKAWPYPAAELFLDRRTPLATLDAAVKPDERCNAQFYVAEWQILKHNAPAAIAQLRSALAACPKIHPVYPLIAADLQRLSPATSPIPAPAAKPPAAANPKL